jgi:sulfoacetaldehyde dehydrogenase
MIAELENVGGRLLDADEKQQLQSKLWDQHGHLSRTVIAQSADKVAGACGLKRESLAGAKFLMVSESGWGKDFPFSDEKLSPVLTVYRARDFELACEITSGVLK